MRLLIATIYISSKMSYNYYKQTASSINVRGGTL